MAPKQEPQSKKKPQTPGIPSPSSSVILISPNNQILLLQRVKQSSAFPSAHVFPGGNADPQDGDMPGPQEPGRHEDNEAYRMAAIRECFEESALLLARNNGFGRLIEVPEEEREEGRKAIHAQEVPFTTWLSRKGGRADTAGLIPFTRWITPINQPKRFTTQMYLYFMPTLNSAVLDDNLTQDEDTEVRIPQPRTDGGKEHTTARFLPASAWCRLAQEGRIIMFPPQFFLLHQIAQHLDALPSPTAYGAIKRVELPRDELIRRRNSLIAFVKTGQPPWTDKVISPTPYPLQVSKSFEGRSVLNLSSPGPELKDSGRVGVTEQCVLVNFRKEGPRQLAIIDAKDAVNAKL